LHRPSRRAARVEDTAGGQIAAGQEGIRIPVICGADRAARPGRKFSSPSCRVAGAGKVAAMARSTRRPAYMTASESAISTSSEQVVGDEQDREAERSRASSAPEDLGGDT